MGCTPCSSRVTARWEFERDGETVRLAPSGPLVATTPELEVHAALAGLGLVCTFEEDLKDALAAGALASLLQEWLPSFSGPRLYYAECRHMPAPLRALVDFIKADRA